MMDAIKHNIEQIDGCRVQIEALKNEQNRADAQAEKMLALIAGLAKKINKEEADAESKVAEMGSAQTPDQAALQAREESINK